jgi:hypothetical protein
MEQQEIEALRRGKEAVRARRRGIDAPPSRQDDHLLQRMRVRRVRGWSAAARLVAAYGRLHIQRLPRALRLVPRWSTYRRPWWGQTQGDLEIEWIVPTARGDLRVRKFGDPAEVWVEFSARSMASIRAERTERQARYETVLSLVADQIAAGTIRLTEQWAPAPGQAYATDGQKGGSIQYGFLDTIASVSLSGALRRAGVTVSPNEAPIEALRRHLAEVAQEDRAPRLRGLTRVRRLPASDRARAVA